jgi:D-aspartate ligase
VSSARYAQAAIVLGTEVNGIAVIRSLGRLGVRCAAIRAPTRGDHTARSRYLAFTHSVTRDATDEELLSAVRAAATRLGGNGPTVLMPTTDRYAEFLSRNLGALADGFFPCCPDPATADAFLDKWKTAQVCLDNGILIPKTACPTTADTLASAGAEMRYPVIVKPRYTYGTDFPGKNAIIDDATGLVRFFGAGSLLGKCVIQEIIPSGDGDILVTATYSGKDGRVRAIYSGRKIRQFLPDYGATCFGVSERHPALEDASRRFLDNLGYRGFAALEFSRSRADGRAYFLELNTRTYYHNQLFADAGVDLTQIAYLDLTRHHPTAVPGQPTQEDGIVWLDFRRDFQSMRIKRRAGRITIGQWLRSIATARSFAIWNWRDPFPFACACAWRWADMIRNLLRRLAR